MKIGETYQRQMHEMQDQSQVIKWLMDPSKQLQRFEMRLRGKRFDDKQKVFVDTDIEPIMNEVGISRVITFLSPFIDVATSSANLDSEQIAKMGRINMRSFVVDLGVHYKEYDLDQAEIKTICLLVASQLLLMLTQAKDGAGNEKIMNILKVQETQLQNLQNGLVATNQRIFR